MNATLTTEMHSSIDRYLGSRAETLLSFRNPKIPRSRLHLPGPDVVDRIYALSDRKPQVLVNLQRIFGHDRLADSGYITAYHCLSRRFTRGTLQGQRDLLKG